MRKTHGKWREREDKSEMKIFCQNILVLESERKFPLTCLKSNPFLVLEDQFVGGMEKRRQKEKGKRKKKRKSENKGKSLGRSIHWRSGGEKTKRKRKKEKEKEK